MPTDEAIPTARHAAEQALTITLPWLCQTRWPSVSGQTKAKAAYQDFLTLWKDADPAIPIFMAAKAEYAQLE